MGQNGQNIYVYVSAENKYDIVNITLFVVMGNLTANAENCFMSVKHFSVLQIFVGTQDSPGQIGISGHCKRLTVYQSVMF